MEDTPEQLDALKDVNDWNETLDENKMIKWKLGNKFKLDTDRKSIFLQINITNIPLEKRRLGPFVFFFR